MPRGTEVRAAATPHVKNCIHKSGCEIAAAFYTKPDQSTRPQKHVHTSTPTDDQAHSDRHTQINIRVQ